MNEQRSNLPPMQLASLKVAAWLLSLTLSFSAAAACDPPPGPEREGRPESSRVAHGMDNLRQQLKLDSAQEALFKGAFDATEKLRQDFRDAMLEKRDQLKSKPDAKTLDLRALAKEMDKEKADQDAKRKVVREAWLKFYDALKPEQKEQASKFLLMQIGMMGEGPGMRGGHGGPGGEGHGPSDRGGFERGDRPQPPRD